MRLPFTLLAALSLAACLDSWDKPLSTAPSKGEPCGPVDVPCFEPVDGGLRATGMCCGEYTVCGGAFPNVGCPAGACCSADVGAARDAGRSVRVVSPQRAAAP